MKNPPRVNYDAVASRYDQRVQGTYLKGATDALRKLAQRLKANHVLDLGCGTGRSLQGFVQMEHRPICCGLDFSPGMLMQARQLEPDYRLVNASAPAPPFVDGCFDLVCCTLAFHHFPNKRQVVQRAFDMLRPGGAFAIVNIDPHQSGQSWPVYDFFEGVYEADLKRFPSLAEQQSILAQAGFQQISSRMVEHIFHKIVGEAILDEIYYRILRDDHNGALRGVLQRQAQVQHIARAVDHIHQNIDQAVSVEALAEMVNMSTTTFHRRFKEVMHLPPLQYAKSIKLHRAQTLIREGKRANEAGYLVGYNSPAQFSREYKRQFGYAPSAEY